MQIRKATFDDISCVMGLERASATAAHWTLEQYQSLFHTVDSGMQRLALVAEGVPGRVSDSGNTPTAKQALLGFLVAWHLAGEWELENIVVAAESRRAGIGKRLMDALLAEARRTTKASVFLEVRESNAVARALYEKAGFKVTGRRRRYYADPEEDAVLYRWDSMQLFSE